MAASGGEAAPASARGCAPRASEGPDLLQAAEKLHVDPKMLEALEAEDFAALGAPVYVRGHLRRYAELVGESAASCRTCTPPAYAAAQPDLTRIPQAEPPS